MAAIVQSYTPASEKINFPWYLYPGVPLSGYYDTELYISELYRLTEYLNCLHKKMSTTKKNILHITIGAAMEEYYTECESDIGLHWQQLFPHHLQVLIDDPMINIYHIIISPNKSFSVSEFKQPLFISNTKKYKWTISHDRIITNSQGNMEIAIFYTPMPSVDGRNIKILDKLKLTKLYKDGLLNLDSYVQTYGDINFITEFYKLLHSVCGHIQINRGYVTCFSYAVFNSDTEKASFNNYVMFQEIKQLFNEKYDTSNRLLAEWQYHKDCYTMKVYDGHSYDKSVISYVVPNKYMGLVIKYINIIDGTIKLLPANPSIGKLMPPIIKHQETNHICKFDESCLDMKIVKNKLLPRSLINDMYMHIEMKIEFPKLIQKIIEYINNTPSDTINMYMNKLFSFKTLIENYRMDYNDVLYLYKNKLSLSNNDINVIVQKNKLLLTDIVDGELEIMAFAELASVCVIIIKGSYEKVIRPNICSSNTIYLWYDMCTNIYSVMKK